MILKLLVVLKSFSRKSTNPVTSIPNSIPTTSTTSVVTSHNLLISSTSPNGTFPSEWPKVISNMIVDDKLKDISRPATKLNDDKITTPSIIEQIKKIVFHTNQAKPTQITSDVKEDKSSQEDVHDDAKEYFNILNTNLTRNSQVDLSLPLFPSETTIIRKEQNMPVKILKVKHSNVYFHSIQKLPHTQENNC